ncbi:ricin-type beta-trefoil lectin domain protein [Kitasatospora sp. NBC_00240]|uniref:protein kinase domain-containing protein n=1 Tax=Kitasatospora sp. NBC_00240 TaxID=2903567 RepID=UPI0022522752|nr:ricin-type beta-trefoil lectin domain protein [Kitasatospora sp. NBC_00240]MCX5214313.1 ricin-type beta-trefoil lectin domain protein [Kitasatospora sp. NBC_00240]
MEPLKVGDPRQVGPYHLLGRLGRGGMGQVFVGRSPGGRVVAVKVVHPEIAGDAQFRRRFAHEVAAARRVGGFYTAQVVDADPGADPPWLVTAYVPGPSLQQAVDAHGPLPAGAVGALGAGLAEALTAIHGAGLVHRDLKPGNILLAADGPRVIDFGISRGLDGTHISTTIVGTPGFMSPEQAKGLDVGPPGDVFALGAVLMFAATGRGPFGAGSIESIVYRIVHADPDLTGLPAPLAELVGTCLAKDPARRPALADVLHLLAGPAATAGRWIPSAVTRMIAEREGELSDQVGTLSMTVVAADPSAARTTPLGQVPPLLPPGAWSAPRPPRRMALRAVIALCAVSLAAGGAIGIRTALAHHADRAQGAAPSGPQSPAPLPTSPAGSRDLPTSPASSRDLPSAAAPRSPAPLPALPVKSPAAPSVSAPGPVTHSASGLCVDTEGPQHADVTLRISDCGYFSGQIWSYRESGHSLVNPPSGLCLDTAGPPVAGLDVVLRPCGNFTGQQWAYDAVTSRITNLPSGLCLDTAGPPADYVKLVLNTCGNRTGQSWQL